GSVHFNYWKMSEKRLRRRVAKPLGFWEKRNDPDASSSPLTESDGISDGDERNTVINGNTVASGHDIDHQVQPLQQPLVVPAAANPSPYSALIIHEELVEFSDIEEEDECREVVSPPMPAAVSDGRATGTTAAARPTVAAVADKEKNEKRFECEICKSTFTERRCLKNHMVSHSDDRRHVCDACAARYLHHAHLRNHQKAYCITEKCPETASPPAPAAS
ncbi:hypothetical protein PFISCL1PPCAC_4384, partial [Pristionchus fissidentatus]